MTPDKPTQALLAEQRLALETLLELNAKAVVDKPGRSILNGLDKLAHRYLAKIRAEQRRVMDGPYGTLGSFGENGLAPRIRNLVRDAEFHRAIARSAQHDRNALEEVKNMGKPRRAAA